MQELTLKEQPRPIFTFTIPQAMAGATEINTIGIIQLKGHEELMASRRAAGNPMQLAWELAKASVYRINDKPVQSEDVDRLWERPEAAKIRTLIVSAYNKINQPEGAETESFLGSMTVVI